VLNKLQNKIHHVIIFIIYVIAASEPQSQHTDDEEIAGQARNDVLGVFEILRLTSFALNDIVGLLIENGVLGVVDVDIGC
ncbi:MAG: hypothetical protein SNG96_06195, partial [Rikenellaceae bacterium]